MALINLKMKEVAQLEKLVTAASDAWQILRAQALLWLDEGESVEEVAERLRASACQSPTVSIDESADAACCYLLEMSRFERLTKAGILSGNFWLTS
jgi:hypothetical protein